MPPITPAATRLAQSLEDFRDAVHASTTNGFEFRIDRSLRQQYRELFASDYTSHQNIREQQQLAAVDNENHELADNLQELWIYSVLFGTDFLETSFNHLSNPDDPIERLREEWYLATQEPSMQTKTLTSCRDALLELGYSDLAPEVRLLNMMIWINQSTHEEDLTEAELIAEAEGTVNQALYMRYVPGASPQISREEAEILLDIFNSKNPINEGLTRALSMTNEPNPNRPIIFAISSEIIWQMSRNREGGQVQQAESLTRDALAHFSGEEIVDDDPTEDYEN